MLIVLSEKKETKKNRMTAYFFNYKIFNLSCITLNKIQ